MGAAGEAWQSKDSPPSIYIPLSSEVQMETLPKDCERHS